MSSPTASLPEHLLNFEVIIVFRTHDSEIPWSDPEQVPQLVVTLDQCRTPREALHTVISDEVWGNVHFELPLIPLKPFEHPSTDQHLCPGVRYISSSVLVGSQSLERRIWDFDEMAREIVDVDIWKGLSRLLHINTLSVERDGSGIIAKIEIMLDEEYVIRSLEGLAQA